MIITSGTLTSEAQALVAVFERRLNRKHKGLIRVVSEDDIRVSFLDNHVQSTAFYYFYRRRKSDGDLWGLGWRLRVVHITADGRKSCVVYDRQKPALLSDTIAEARGQLIEMTDYHHWPNKFAGKGVLEL